MNKLALPLGFVLCALLGAGWLKAHDRMVEERAFASHVADSLRNDLIDERSRFSASERMRVAAQDSLIADRRAQLAKQAEAVRAERRASQAVQTARASLDAALDSLAGSDSVRVLLEQERAAGNEMRGALVAQVSALTVQLALADSTVAILGQRIAARDSLMAGLEEAIEAERELAAYWEKEANPGFFAGLWKGLPGNLAWAGGAIAIVLALK